MPRKKVKKKKAPWNPEIAAAKAAAKLAHGQWKSAGRPNGTHPTATTKRTAKKLLRRAQRQQAARERQKNLKKLSEARKDDSKLFHSIVRAQRSAKTTNTKELVFQNKLFSGDLTAVWDMHFAALATPHPKDCYTDRRQAQAAKNVSMMKDIAKGATLPVDITALEVLDAIMSQKCNKASDVYGLAAEHLKNAPHIVTTYLTPVINSIFNTGRIPDSLKVGLLHPIHKKGKPKNDPGNYRGITITPLIMKIMDKIILAHQRAATTETSHPLQFGFTPGKSGLHAAFLLGEAIAESKDKGDTLFVASLDVQKAFDTVQHSSLLDKLHHAGVQGPWWNLKYDTYDGLMSQVVWNGQTSDQKISIKQGNGQGKLPSPDDYKLYLHNLLEMISASNTGFNVGSIPIPTPTCADDMLAISSNLEDLQTMVSFIAHYANEEHYTIHPVKSVVVPFNIRSKPELQHLVKEPPIDLNGTPLPVEKDLLHLGIKRGLLTANPTIEDRVSLARRTLYSLMGPGLHGLNGLPVPVSIHLYETYVLSRATFGLDTIVATITALKPLEQFHKKAIRSMLGLPERTAIAALYILSGILPMQHTLHIQALKFLLSLMTDETTREVILRQYIMKTKRSASWVTHIERILSRYNLPTIPDLHMSPPTKLQWKRMVNEAVYLAASQEIAKEALSRSTLGLLNPLFTARTPHNALCHIENPLQVARANTKIRLLVDVYPLATVQKRMKQIDGDICSLCDLGETEDRLHFLTRCPALSEVRTKYLHRILALIPHTDDLDTENLDQFLVGLILDPSHPDVAEIHILDPSVIPEVETITRDYIFALHLKRTNIVKYADLN